MLSKYYSSIRNEYGIKIGGFNEYVPNLGHKSKYVLHYRNLQSHLSLDFMLSFNIQGMCTRFFRGSFEKIGYIFHG